jgi:carboxylesterase
MATYLNKRGLTVHCPLLPGHGEHPNKIDKVPHEAWIAEAEEALVYLRQRCDEIFLMGHSMGTILGAYLVLEYGEFKGQMMLAPVYDVPDWRIRTLRFMRYVVPWFYPMKSKRLQDLVYQRIREFDPTIDLDDPETQAKLPEMTRVPTSGMDEMRKVVDMGREMWPRLDLPVIAFQGKLDPAASAENTEKLFALLPNKDRELIRFEDAGHELMRPFEPVHDQVWSKTFQFFQTHSSLQLVENSADNPTARQ